MTNLICHRGVAKLAPENTLPAFLLAGRTKADGIEFDVQLTKDKEIVVCHDKTVDRTSNGEGHIHDMTLKELRALDFGEYFDARYKGTKIPTLQEVLIVAKRFKMINIELKSQKAGDLEIAQRVLFEVSYHQYPNFVIYSSFEKSILKEIQKEDPGAVTAFIYSPKGKAKYGLSSGYTDFALEEGFQYLHPYYLTMDRHYIANCHQQGIGVNVWGADSRRAIAKLIREGCDGIVTDEIERAIAIRDQAKK